ARALANDPPILVADEPTGNLDSRSAQAVFHLFESLVAQGKTILMVTHDNELARRASRTITLADGELLDEHLAQVFPALPHDQLLVATRQIEPQTYAPGQVIIQAGDDPDRFYIVTAGKAEVLLPDRWGEQSVVATLQNGQYFGEMAILNGSTRNATVRAGEETAVSVVTLSPDAFHTLIDQSPSTRADLERTVEARAAANQRRSQQE
ncbi:MAG: cyclic nucleotide-binding domain-containing protein, partial [Anaerolineales bacterium]|nr:cyclic nucleotide-binding domain-containing protein [Anaerolineales bacterium]